MTAAEMVTRFPLLPASPLCLCSWPGSASSERSAGLAPALPGPAALSPSGDVNGSVSDTSGSRIRNSKISHLTCWEKSERKTEKTPKLFAFPSATVVLVTEAEKTVVICVRPVMIVSSICVLSSSPTPSSLSRGFHKS